MSSVVGQVIQRACRVRRRRRLEATRDNSARKRCRPAASRPQIGSRTAGALAQWLHESLGAERQLTHRWHDSWFFRRKSSARVMGRSGLTAEWLLYLRSVQRRMRCTAAEHLWIVLYERVEHLERFSRRSLTKRMHNSAPFVVGRTSPSQSDRGDYWAESPMRFAPALCFNGPHGRRQRYFAISRLPAHWQWLSVGEIAEFPNKPK